MAAESTHFMIATAFFALWVIIAHIAVIQRSSKSERIDP